MAATTSSASKLQTKSSEKRDYDSELDFFSENFDPLKALNTPGLKPPVPNAGAYDNLNKYESDVIKHTAHTAHAHKEKEELTRSGDFKRKFLPHQSKLFSYCF